MAEPYKRDRIAELYPHVNEDETPLPRAWNNQDKYNFIGLSQNNLRAHYKGIYYNLYFNTRLLHSRPKPLI